MASSTNDDAASTGAVGVKDASPAADLTGRGEVRTRNHFHQFFKGNIRVIEVLEQGVADLAVLLVSPGREFAALELMGAGVVGGDGDELVDQRARRAYEDRLGELQGEIDEAERNNDSARVDLRRAEFDDLVDQLTSSLGLGGRSRRTAGEAERARSAVTQRIRTTIKRLSELDEALGSHLRVSVSTGAFVSYRPVTPTTWSVHT